MPEENEVEVEQWQSVDVPSSANVFAVIERSASVRSPKSISKLKESLIVASKAGSRSIQGKTQTHTYIHHYL